jgi:NAD(P)-dependent dehydrogenase (short-subunit alcohol dehydrogenase family)
MKMVADVKALTGKVAVVTGASSGIGRETAKLFAESGARIVVSPAKKKTGSRISGAGDGCKAHDR